MFNYVEQARKKSPAIGCDLKSRPVGSRRFVSGQSNTFTDDFSPIASKTEDYSGDSLVSARVPIKAAPSASSGLDLATLDGVDEQSMKILESEKIIVNHDKDN